jgi:hypothetical protein
VFGERETLIKVAQERLRKEPGRYVQHIYGLTEAGGTSVLYLSGVDFERVGLPTNVLDRPYPPLTWQVLSKIPYVVSIGGLSLFGVWWTIERRMKLAKEQAEASRADRKEDSDRKGRSR